MSSLKRQRNENVNWSLINTYLTRVAPVISGSKSYSIPHSNRFAIHINHNIAYDNNEYSKCLTAPLLNSNNLTHNNTYTYIIFKNTKTNDVLINFMLANPLEIGTKHLHICHKFRMNIKTKLLNEKSNNIGYRFSQAISDYRLVFAGEMHYTNDTITFNLISGTYTANKVKNKSQINKNAINNFVKNNIFQKQFPDHKIIYTSAILLPRNFNRQLRAYYNKKNTYKGFLNKIYIRDKFQTNPNDPNEFNKIYINPASPLFKEFVNLVNSSNINKNKKLENFFKRAQNEWKRVNYKTSATN